MMLRTKYKSEISLEDIQSFNANEKIKQTY